MKWNETRKTTTMSYSPCLAQFIPVNPILVPVNSHPTTVLKESDDLVDNFDAKMTFENHVPSVSRVADQRIGIIRKSCMAIISCLIAPCETFSEVRPAGILVLFSSVLHSCRLTP